MPSLFIKVVLSLSTLPSVGQDSATKCDEQHPQRSTYTVDVSYNSAIYPEIIPHLSLSTDRDVADVMATSCEKNYGRGDDPVMFETRIAIPKNKKLQSIVRPIYKRNRERRCHLTGI